MAAMTSAFALGQILGPLVVSLGFAPALILAASVSPECFLLEIRHA